MSRLIVAGFTVAVASIALTAIAPKWLGVAAAVTEAGGVRLSPTEGRHAVAHADVHRGHRTGRASLLAHVWSPPGGGLEAGGMPGRPGMRLGPPTMMGVDPSTGNPARALASLRMR